MSRRRSFFERDAQGRERIVIVNRTRSSSHDKSTRELLAEADEREQALIAQVSSLTTRLSFAERNEWAIRQQHTALVNEHHNCRQLRAQVDAQLNEIRRLDSLLNDEEDKTNRLKGKVEKLEEKIRLMKRGVVEDYRHKYDNAMKDMDLLTQRMVDKNEELRLADARIAEKNRTIVYLKDYLQQLGYRVQF
jgi:peptidoglycan hydrolase CwlO-like protein